jgi:hypothetical protein
MPWEEKGIMSLREEFVAKVLNKTMISLLLRQ